MNNPHLRNFFHLARAYSLGIKNGRTREDIHQSVIEEREELDLELSGNGDGVDGIVGEGIDEIVRVADLIFTEKPNITEDEFYDTIFKKLEKWREKYSDNSFDDILAQLPQPPCETAAQLSDASELFRLAQLSGDDGVGTAEKRILAYLQERDYKLYRDKNDAIENVLGLIDTPIGRRRFGTDSFYKDVIDSLRKAIGR